MYQEDREAKEKEETKEKPKERLKEESSKFMKSGEMRQCNEGKWEFKLLEYDDPQFSNFHIHLPKFMDTSLIDVEVFPRFVSIRVKGKLTQIKLWEEVFVNPEKV